MQKILTATLAAAGFLAASQFCFAGALAPAPGSQNAPETSQTVLAKYAGGMGHGGMSMGHSSGPRSFSMGHGPMGRHMTMRNGRTFAFHDHHHHRHFGRGAFFGFGLDYGYPDWYDSGSCYRNCRAEGYGPGYCRANAWEYCG